MQIKIVSILSILIFTSMQVSACEEKSLSVTANNSSEAIDLARTAIPEGYEDNSECTSPIVSCSNGFDFDETGELCVQGTQVEQVSATISIKSL